MRIALAQVRDLSPGDFSPHSLFYRNGVGHEHGLAAVHPPSPLGLFYLNGVDKSESRYCGTVNIGARDSRALQLPNER